MQTLSKNLAVTGALAALVCALPVSIDFAHPGATAPSLSQALGVGLKIDTAEARIGRPATPRSFAGYARRTMRTPAVGVVVVRPMARPYVARPFVADAAVAGAAAATTSGTAATTGTASSTGTTGTAGTTAAAAQQPSPAQIGAIRNACRADFIAHCSGVAPGGREALACLLKNVAALSPGCQQAVSAVSQAAPQTPAEQSAAAPPASAPATGGATAAPAPSATLAPAAPSVGSSTARPAGGLGMRLALFARACVEDVQVNCPGMRPGGGQILACLAANQAKLSPGCRQMLAGARQSM